MLGVWTIADRVWEFQKCGSTSEVPYDSHGTNRKAACFPGLEICRRSRRERKAAWS